MENNTYAPILLFVYNRPAHTRRLVESLLQNAEAAQSHLFVYSDAARHAEAAEDVAEVRRYVRSLSGFGALTVIERNENWGLARSMMCPPLPPSPPSGPPFGMYFARCRCTEPAPPCPDAQNILT